ncbi:ATPase, T2SS/T4P/T4SS family [Janthinobacterium sp. CAN_S7]|uniref:GspE/PulE family protein n=1 Tax=Janthinobacterium sp. CAN_S7 TaxID=3071704 RepID=UPI00319E91E0
MNAPIRNIVASLGTEIDAQLKEWGVTDDELNPELLAYATHIANIPDTIPGKRIGDIVVEFNFSTPDEIEKYAATKPANIFLLEHLSNNIDNLRPHTQMLLAANDRLAYYDLLTYAPIHPEFHTNKTLRAFCQDNNCLPLTSNANNVLRLVFADYSTQKEYAQLSRILRAKDPVGQLRETFGYVDLILSVGQREQIAIHLHSESNEAVEAFEDDDKINFWQESAANTDNQKILARILGIAAEKKASNIKFTPDHDGLVHVLYRRHGNLRPIPNIHPLSAKQADEINRFLHTKSVAKHTDTAKRVEGRLLSPADGQFIYRTGTSETFLRCSYIPVANNGLSFAMESISIRLLPRDAVSIKLDDINIAEPIITALNSNLMQSHGLILLVGPTSSGKSTTIAGITTLYREIYGDTKNLVSLEQPVERQLKGITQFSVHQSNFEAGMAALLRHDPNFIFVGELRDRPSASTCIRAANTGSIVVSTLHADDCPTAYNALLSYISNNTGTRADSVIVTEYDAISALSLIIAQRLIPTLCEHCRLEITNTGARNLATKVKAYEEYCARNGYERQNINHSFVRNDAGCQKCDFEGYSGETPINEILPITRSLRQQLVAMANNKTNDLDILAKHRHRTLFDEAMRLVTEGLVSIENALI